MRDRSLVPDAPITDPSQDRFGVSGFCATIAESIRATHEPEGTVVALTGPWGCGKTSARNLVTHHLKPEREAGEIVIVDFKCWWFRGEEALTRAFLTELYVALAPSLGSRATRTFWKLTKLLHHLPSLGRLAVGAAGAENPGEVVVEAVHATVSAAQDYAKLDDAESLESLYGDVARALRANNRRVLITVDDIDRLTDVEAMHVFRLIKSAGQLPNTMYLLLYDRNNAERITNSQHPRSEASFLDKIVQASFDLPEPQHPDLQRLFFAQVEQTCGPLTEEEGHSILASYYAVIARELRTPRDVMRLCGALAITWPAIAGDVATSDFIAIESLRLLQPSLYQAIRRSKSILCGTGVDTQSGSDDTKKEYTTRLLEGIKERDQPHYQHALRHLFPRLDRVWGNLSHGPGTYKRWLLRRRACTEQYFDAYFRFELGDDALRKSTVNELATRVSEPGFLERTLSKALETPRRSGGTQAALVLDELNLRAESITDEERPEVLKTIFALADKLDAPLDRERGYMAMNSNRLRLRVLTRALSRKHTELAERSACLATACVSASLGWLLEFAYEAWRDYQIPKGQDTPSEAEMSLTLDDCIAVRAQALERAQLAAQDGTIMEPHDLGLTLFHWSALIGDRPNEVHKWTASQMASDEWLEMLCGHLTSDSWVMNLGFGDSPPTPAQRIPRARTDIIEWIVDAPRLRERVEQIAVQADRHPKAAELLRAWESQEREGDDR